MTLSVEFTNVYKIPGEAIEVLFELCCERERNPETAISFRRPTMEQHRRFFFSRPYRRWYLVRELGADTWAGTVSVTRRNELGIVLFESHQGRGIGPAALEWLMGWVKPLPAKASWRPGHWVANIAPGNERSIRVFEKLGFELEQVTYARR